MKKLALAFLLLATPALAQSPNERAYQQTIQELTQAWIGARTALLAEQDKNTVAETKIKDLQDKLPRQEPVKGPSGQGANTPKVDTP